MCFLSACSTPVLLVLKNATSSEVVLCLADSRRITLAPGQIIKLPLDYNSKNPTIELNGRKFSYTMKYPPDNYFHDSSIGRVFGLEINGQARLVLRRVSPRIDDLLSDDLGQPFGFPISPME